MVPLDASAKSSKKAKGKSEGYRRNEDALSYAVDALMKVDSCSHVFRVYALLCVK